MSQDPNLGPRYRLRERLGDHLAGWSDGRRMLPNVPTDKPINSPKLAQIGADHLRRLETIHLAHAEAEQPFVADLMDCDRQLVEGDRKIETQLRDLARREQVGVKTGRGIGENSYNEHFIVTRRQREYQDDVAALRHEITTAFERQAQLQAKRDTAQTQLDAGRVQLGARVRRIEALCARRRSTYLRGVTRTHGDRVELSDFADSTPMWNGTVVTR